MGGWVRVFHSPPLPSPSVKLLSQRFTFTLPTATAAAGAGAEGGAGAGGGENAPGGDQGRGKCMSLCCLINCIALGCYGSPPPLNSSQTQPQTNQDRHSGRSRFYGGGGYDTNNNGSGGDCGRPYYVQPWRDRAFGAPLEYRMIRPLPPAIVRAYGQLQSMSFQGLWAEIHRAWMTVDNVLYLWDYHTEESIVQVCGPLF